jgi:hypothetical protein
MRQGAGDTINIIESARFETYSLVCARESLQPTQPLSHQDVRVALALGNHGYPQ